MNETSTPRLKLALQKSGRLTESSLDLLARCGLKVARGKDQLVAISENMPFDLLFVRDDDIPDLVEEDVCDLGMVGLNVLEEQRLAAASLGKPMQLEIVRPLDFGHCRLAIAVPYGVAYQGVQSLQNARIATSYPLTLQRFLDERAITAEVVRLSGSVEIAPRLGRADAICDLVATGSTLVANQLREVQTVLESHTVLVRTPKPLSAFKREWFDRLLVRIEGVLQVKESKYVMLHAPRAALAEIKRLLPGSASPTVIPLEGEHDLVAVHAVCRETVFWETLESLKRAGASALLVLPLEKILA